MALRLRRLEVVCRQAAFTGQRWQPLGRSSPKRTGHLPPRTVVWVPIVIQPHHQQNDLSQLPQPTPRRKTLHSPQTEFAMAFKPITGVRAAIGRPGQPW